MTNPKWEIGPVELVNGYDGNILLFCEHRKAYLGTYEVPGGGLHCIEWRQDGTCYYGRNDLHLAPPPKKTVLVHGWLNVYREDCVSWSTKELADKNADPNRIACVEFDLGEVEEGEGLS